MPKDEKKEPYITITLGGSGYFPVKLWWNPELGGFWEPWSTGVGRYKTREGAIPEAKAWAEAEDLEFKP